MCAKLAGVQPDIRDDSFMVSTQNTSVGPRLRMRAFRGRNEIDNNAAVSSVQCRAVVKRRGTKSVRPMKLYAFPSFDRSDALLFVPSTFVSFMNSNDIPGLSRLLFSRFDKNCEVYMPYLGDRVASVNDLINFHSQLNDLLPDAIVCVHSTKVVENEIRATTYTKYTTNKTIYDSLARSNAKKQAMPMFSLPRDANIKRSLELQNDDDYNRDEMIETLDTDQDLVVYMQCNMVLTIDDITKKITRYTIDGQITSIKPV